MCFGGGVFKWRGTLTADANEEDHVKMVLGRARILPTCVYLLDEGIVPLSDVLRIRIHGKLERPEDLFAYKVDFFPVAVASIESVL